MEPTVVLLAVVGAIVAVAVLSRRTGIASPLILLLVGIVASYTPLVPTFEIEPEWILAGVLPPLLYSAAVSVPVIDFRRNLKAITGLSVLLVIVTSLAVGLVLYLLLPSVGVAAAIALGAVISPTDAVAATSIGKRLGLPARLVTVLEGESLVNDASALVLLRTAIAAMAGTVSLWSVIADFAYAVVAAALIGLVVGWFSVTLRSWLNDPVLTTTVSFMVPFIAYVPAEQLGASGVLAVVVAGLVTGHRGARLLAASERISEHTNWLTVQFLLEHGVFLLMGLELRGLVNELETAGGNFGQAVRIGLILTTLVVVVRFAFVVPQMAFVRRDERRSAERSQILGEVKARLDAFAPQDDRSRRRKAKAQNRVAQRTADLQFFERQGLSWRGIFIISWAGMRGVVTLAAAQSLPAGTPHRALLILVAFTVAVVSLVVLGGSLPWVIRRSHIKGDNPTAFRAELDALLDDANKAALAVLDDPAQTNIDGKPADPAVIEMLRARHSNPNRQLGATQRARTDDFRTQLAVIEGRMLDAARSELLDARAIGAHSSQAIKRAQTVFDLEEYRIFRMQRGL